MTLQRSPEYRGQFPMRLAVTSADGQGGYPAAEEDPDKRMVYPITFVDATYPKTPGLAAVTITKRSAAATEFVCNLARGYIGVDTLIWCFFYRKRWWTRLCCKCLIFQDGFNRLTNTYVGVAWTEDDGYELEGDW
jgi:hypothetical protein